MAKVKRVHLYKELLSCPTCAGDGDTTITEGTVPNGLLPHSPLSASLAAEVIYRKIADFLPFFRMEKDAAQLGAVIPRETSLGWFIKCSEKYFLPIYNALHEEQLKREVLHAGETTCQVLREEGK